MTTPLCGKPNSRKRPCRMPRMRGFDGCKDHRMVTPDILAIEAAHERMKHQSCLELHGRNPWLGNAEWWLDELDKAQRWAADFRPHARPACWEWDASESTLDAVRAEVLEDRARRAPADTPEAELHRDLDWEVFIVWHRHRCAWCDTVGQLEVDHDHTTKLIRGLLCSGCNFHEGYHCASRTKRARTSYHYGAPSFGADRYRQKNPATLLGLQRNYSRKNAFPAWCQLAERRTVGAAPLGTPDPLPFGEGVVRRAHEAAVAARLADQARQKLKGEVLALQETLGWFRCKTCHPWWGREDFRVVEPVANWVRTRFPGVHERAAEHAREMFMYPWRYQPLAVS